MHRWLIILVLALTGCAEHRGWNPNYQFRSGDYGTYLAKREVALMTGGDGPRTIPVTVPLNAPSAESIAGTSPVPIPATMRIRKRAYAPAVPVARSPATTSPEAQYGSYRSPTLAP